MSAEHEAKCMPDSPRGLIDNAGCIALNCHAWRNATCQPKVHQCLCDPSQCIIDGACVNQGDTSKVTGGSCAALTCNAYRKATCVDGACMCKEDESAVGGECVPKGGCPKYTGVGCHFYNVEKYASKNDCDSGTCSKDGYCQCADNECAVGGKCQPKSGAVVALSIADAKTRQQSQSAAPLAFFAVASLAASALFLVARRTRENREVAAATDYIQVA